MSTGGAREAPAWLADFQAHFGEALRTPLDRTRGTLIATPASYPSALAADAGAARLAVYNRQYWFRLFTVLHDAFPLTARLVGYWDFNEHAAAYLRAHPPRTWDLDDVPAGFATFFVDRLGGGLEEVNDERRAWGESALVDHAYREVFRAPAVTPFRPTAEDAARLLETRLIPSPAVIRIREHSALVDLRRALLARRDASTARLALPARHADPGTRVRDWAIVREDAATRAVLLEPREAELLALLTAHPVGEALARLEDACSLGERSALPAATQRWLARSVQLGFWRT